MAPCEMCGRDTTLVVAEIESVNLKVCPNCARFGKIKSSGQSYRPRHLPVKQEAPAYRLVSNIASLLHQAREAKKMTQEDFAKLLQERESTVIKWENGSMQPDVETATRVGRILGLSLVQREEADAQEVEKGKRLDELTIGDFVKVRKRKG